MFSFSAWLAIPLSSVISSEPVSSASARKYVSKPEGAVDSAISSALLYIMFSSTIMNVLYRLSRIFCICSFIIPLLFNTDAASTIPDLG